MSETSLKLVIDWDKKTVCLMNTTSGKLSFALSESLHELAKGSLNSKSRATIQGSGLCDLHVTLVLDQEVTNTTTATTGSVQSPMASKSCATVSPENCVSAIKQSDPLPLKCVDEAMNKAAIDYIINSPIRKQNKASRGCKYGAPWTGCNWEGLCQHNECSHALFNPKVVGD